MLFVVFCYSDPVIDIYKHKVQPYNNSIKTQMYLLNTTQNFMVFVNGIDINIRVNVDEERHKVIQNTKQQTVVTLTVLQTRIPELLDSRIRNTPSVRLLCPQQVLLLNILKNKAHLIIGLLRIGQVLFCLL